MQNFSLPLHVRRAVFLVAAVCCGVSLTACGSSGGVTNPFTSPAAKVRFVNGSPDAGPVDVFIDNQGQFNTPATPVAYGSATGYLVNLNAGSHAIVIYTAGNDTSAGQLFSGNVSVNNGQRYSFVLTGELHPSYQAGSNLTVTTFADQPYNTPAGGAAVNFHNASPFSSTFSGAAVQFGYYTGSTPSSNALGNPVGFGGVSQPIGLQGAQLNAPITFYAVSPTSGITTQPSAWSSNCASNSFPCDTGNLSLYLIDGPAASTSPAGGIGGGANAKFVGVFDTNGF